MERESLNEARHKVETDSRIIEKVVLEIIEPYVSELDRYVTFIKDCLADGEKAPTDAELGDFCVNLSTLIYFASAMCEQLGIRDDISKAVWKEVYNRARDEGTGTVADKNSYAELQARQEQITNICYSRAYKIVKAKVESSQELLSSCKKVLTGRIQEYELTHITQK